MQAISIQPSKLSGAFTSPPSKSHSMRAILFASLAKGVSHLSNIIASPDASAMIQACRAMGATIKQTSEQTFQVTGFNGKPRLPDNIIDCGNSGQVLRFALAICALCEGASVFTGDASVRFNRPMQPLIDGLNGLGAECFATKNDGHAPVVVRGPIKPGTTRLNGSDSQPVSGLIMACAFLNGDSDIIVDQPGEQPWIDLTLFWLNKFGISVRHEHYQHYHIPGNQHIDAFNYHVPGDFSSIAYAVAAAIITDSSITINNVDMDDIQGDKAIIQQLVHMGANITIDNNSNTLHVHAGSHLRGCEIDMDPFIDAITLFAVIGCFAHGTTLLTNAKIARNKESDRIHCMATELKKMGAAIEEQPDGLIIHNSTLSGAECQSYHDHRIVMSLAVAGCAASGTTTILDTVCVAKSYRDFSQDFNKLGVNIKEYTCD